MEDTHGQAAEAASLASTLATLHTEVAGLESSNDALRGKVSSLHDAAIIGERRREDEIASLHESLQSMQVSHSAHGVGYITLTTLSRLGLKLPRLKRPPHPSASLHSKLSGPVLCPLPATLRRRSKRP